jgi:LuxR family maltose regulon positive regulatory protein
MPTTILLVDDHPLFRKGLHLLLNAEEDMQVIGEANDGQVAIDRVRELSPDVVVMDITMPNFNGIDATRQIISESPDTRVVALSVHSGKRFVEGMLAAGAAGYILKLSAPEELVKGIRAVMRGDVFLSADITGVVVSQYLKVLSGNRENRDTAELTPEESETLQLIVKGHSTEQIASFLQITPEMVASLQRRLMEKLDVSDEAQITEVAHQMGLIAQSGTSVPTHKKDDLPILRTRLQRPSLPADVVHRHHLTSRIDDLLDRPLTLVSAAAGFGKSTLASLWLKAWDGPHAWISLDKSDNDLRLFLSYLLAGIRNAFPGTCDKTRSLLQASHLPPVPVLSRYLLNDLNQIEVFFVLVLDDYHEIREKAVHDLMAAFFTHPPRNLHTLILTRHDPPLLTSILRSRGQVNEIGTSDLQFTTEETANFLKKSLGLSVDLKTAGAVQEKVEGWPAGMRLMSQSLRSSEDLDSLLAGLKGNFGAIVEYLMVEVLSRQSPQMTSLLAKTAILDRFCASLCDVLDGHDAEPGKGGPDGAAFIAKLQRNNLFLIALDIENRWFRYHHMFQQLLKEQLMRQMGPEEIARMYSRVSAWFAKKGLIEEAIKYALEGGDDLAAAQIVERNRLAALDADQWYLLRIWLNRLPHEIKQKRPYLLLGQAWILFMTARIAEVLPIIEQVESLLGDDPKEPALLSEINFFRGVVCYFRSEGARSVALFNKATELLPKNASIELSAEACYWTCLALHLDGRKEAAFRRLHEGIRSKGFHEGMPLSRLSFGLCFLYMLEGDFLKAFQEAMRLSQLGRSNRLVFAETWGMYFLGNASFQMFDLDAARHHFDLIVENQYTAHSRAVVDAMAGLSITHQFLGKPDEADETMNLAQRFAQWTRDPVNFEIVRSCQARLALLRNDHDAALRWQRSLGEVSGISLMLFFLEIPLITQCRVLIAMGSDAGLKEAIERLEALRQNAKAWHNIGQTLEILVLRSMALDKQGRPDEAATTLEKAVAMAAPRDAVRPFVELGPPMADLLERLQKQNVAVDYIEKLLAAFADGEQDATTEVAAHHLLPDEPPVRLSDPEQSLVESLTHRELDVLALLARRLQNKEIAEKLFVSNQTVKSHLKNIYQKLNVSSRRMAVTQAYNLGILTRR